MAVRGLIPKNGTGTSKASSAREGIVCTAPVTPRITWPIAPPRLAAMPSGMPTMMERNSEMPASSRCREVQRHSLCGNDSPMLALACDEPSGWK